MKRMFPTASVLVTSKIDRALTAESLNYFEVATKADLSTEKKSNGKREIIICVRAVFRLKTVFAKHHKISGRGKVEET